MKKIVYSLREHRDLILNWFRARGTVSAGTVEGLNNKCKLTMRKAYGFRMYETIKSRCFTHLATSPSQNSPTNSAEEATKKTPEPTGGHQGSKGYSAKSASKIHARARWIA